MGGQPAPDTARAWKNHRRECGRCERQRPHCAVGRQLFEQHRDARLRGGSTRREGSRSIPLVVLGVLTALAGLLFLGYAGESIAADLYVMNGGIMVSLGLAEIIMGFRSG